MIATTTTTT